MAFLLPMFFAPVFSALTHCPSMFVSSPYMHHNSRDKRFAQISVKPSKGARVICPVIRAQKSPDYEPDAKFYKVEAILRSWKIPKVSMALLKLGVRGVTVSEVKGFGSQGRMKERQAGSEFSEDMFLHKVKMEIVVNKEQVEAVIDEIVAHGRTGQIGDGKIFVVPVADVIKVRTGERAEKAEQTKGEWSDKSSTRD